MNQYKHCDLCQHVKISLKNRKTCAITNKKPMFENTCPNIKFSNSLKKNNKKLLHEYKVAKSKNISVFFKCFLFIGIGSFMIVKSYSLLKHTLNRDSLMIVNFSTTVLVFILGALFLSEAYRNLIGYLKTLKKLKLKKETIEKILDKYRLDFETLIKKKNDTKTGNSDGLFS